MHWPEMSKTGHFPLVTNQSSQYVALRANGYAKTKMQSIIDLISSRMSMRLMYVRWVCAQFIHIPVLL